MSINETNGTPQDNDEAQIILDALREIQNDPELQAEAEKDPQSLLNRLGLSPVARHAVAMGIMAMLAVPLASRSIAIRESWWAN